MASRRFGLIALIAVAVLSCTGPATLPTGGAAMPISDNFAIPPSGFINYCFKYHECGKGSGPIKVQLTPDLYAQLQAVQRNINHSITWHNDYLFDYPTSNGNGNCVAYALVKQRALLALGWPPEAVLLTSAFTETKEGHLVVVVVTTDGDLVLDNRAGKVTHWEALPYRWVARQNPTNHLLFLQFRNPA